MRSHLSDEQFAEAVLDASVSPTGDHLESCPECQAELAGLRTAIADAVEQHRARAERPEAFWQQQRAAVVTRWAAHPPRRRGWRLVWAAAMALVVLAAVLLTKSGAPTRKVNQADSDNALLVDVHRSIQSDLPEALKPAALLALEMERAAGAKSNP